MARIRSIKPDFWRDEDLSSISAEAALLAIGLLNHADDEGYFNANTRLIESDVFPLRNLSSSVPVLLQELSGIGYLSVFSGSDGKQYGLIKNFTKHQVINKPTPSKIRNLIDLPEGYGRGAGGLPLGKEGKGEEGNRKGEEGNDDVFKIHIHWKPSEDANELIKIGRGKLPPEQVLQKHLANFVGYWRTRDDERRQDQWDHAYADWVIRKPVEVEATASQKSEEIYINVLGNRIDTTDKAWLEVFKKDNDEHTPERFRIDREATRAARNKGAA